MPWRSVMVLVSLLLAACSNSPWPTGAAASNTLYTAVLESTPKHLDPTASYWSNDTPITYQVYEPLYGYHYLKRPFTLEPRAAQAVVQPTFIDAQGRVLPADAPASQVAESVYDIPIKPGIRFQPHPAFALDGHGGHRYHALRPGELGERRTPLDFEHHGSRELVAEDFVYALKRHASPRLVAPLLGLFAERVVGLTDYGERLRAEDARLRRGRPAVQTDLPFLDLRRWPLAGASAPQRHLLRIRLQGKYPQWNYWMATTFLAPVPWEADAFYAQPGMRARGLSLDRWPIGTGPYMLTEFVPDRRHVLQRNPNYRGEPYPCEGMPGDREAGLLRDCGKPTPFIDRIVSTVERENVAVRAKFRQGYYDLQAFERIDTGLDYRVDMMDSDAVRARYTEQGFRFDLATDVSVWMLGFNMLDPVVGQGDTPERAVRNRKLRQALSIAIDWEEHARVFPRKSGEVAMGPVPGGVFGSRHGQPQDINPVTHRLDATGRHRRSLDEARQLLSEAGYPQGRDARTGQPLVLHYDYYAAPSPERRAEIDWVVRQFAKIDIQLDVRATDTNPFQDKVRRGQHQVFWMGWSADYPDAENFLFLLYGPNSKTRAEGENTANYQNPEFDRLFAEMQALDNGPLKQALVDRLVAIVREDAPWSFGFFPHASAAVQHWVSNARPASLIRDHGRYLRLDAADRVRRQAAWNPPVYTPLAVASLVAGLLWALLWRQWRVRHAHPLRPGRA